MAMKTSTSVKLSTAIVLLLSIMFYHSEVVAQEVTFANDIAPIIYKNCTTCHRQGEIGPMPFTSYDEISAWGSMLNEVIQSNYMPPWPPSKEYSRFSNERGLTDDEKSLIAEWIENEMPRGDISLEPEVPQFPTGSQIGTPDLILTMEEAFQHSGNGNDEYRVFVLPTGLTEDREIAAIELRPGNATIVHHALFSYDTSGEARNLDQQDSEYGYDGFGGFGIDEAFTRQFPGYVPGQDPYIYPNTLGKTLPAGSDLLIQMHYGPVYTDQLDQSTVNIFFKDEPVERQVREFIMLPFEFSGTQMDKPFFIPANQVETFHGQYTTPIDASILSIAPHMHLLGKSWEVYIEHIDGSLTNVIQVPDWDFNWQGTYNFPRFIVAEQGATIHAIATYDNTIDNPVNPNSPPQFVTWGEKTTDEMYYLPISFVPYNVGDEDIIFDNSVTSISNVHLEKELTHLDHPYPNPSSDHIEIGFTLSVDQRAHLELRAIDGKLIKTAIDSKLYAKGKHLHQMRVDDVQQGTYLVVLSTESGEVRTQTITIN